MAYAADSSQEAEEKDKLLGLCHLQATPRKTEVVAWGYDVGTPGGKRDYLATGLLCILLVVCAITVSGFSNPFQIIYVRGDQCENKESKLVTNAALMQNITNYHTARESSTARVNLTATSYYNAQGTYNTLGTRFTWPSAFDLSEEDRQALELWARQGVDDCQPVIDCVDGFLGWPGGVAVDENTCVSVYVPCPDVESTALLVEYDASPTSLDLFGRNVTRGERFTLADAQTALDEAADAISVIVRRVNIASSIYVLYLAYLVVVTPPFVVYGAKWKQQAFDFLANVGLPFWIAAIVLVWYAHELFKSIINSSVYKVIWANFLEDPCWADPDFLVNTSLSIRETCTDITSAHNLFNQAGANYRYYSEVEDTWQVAGARNYGPFYGDPDEDLLQNFPGSCTSSMLLDAVQPGDGEVNWWSLFFHSGAFVALLLQLVLAHWFISWFSILRPLTVHRGRVMVPQHDPVLYREVRSFARRRAILPFAITTVLLIFLMVNLGITSGSGSKGENVLLGSALLVFLQFGVVPCLIWREEDEGIPGELSVEKQREKGEQRRPPQPPQRQKPPQPPQGQQRQLSRQPSQESRQPSWQPSQQWRQPSQQSRQPSQQSRQPSQQSRQPSQQSRQPSQQSRHHPRPRQFQSQQQLPQPQQQQFQQQQQQQSQQEQRRRQRQLQQLPAQQPQQQQQRRERRQQQQQQQQKRQQEEEDKQKQKQRQEEEEIENGKEKDTQQQEEEENKKKQQQQEEEEAEKEKKNQQRQEEEEKEKQQEQEEENEKQEEKAEKSKPQRNKKEEAMVEGKLPELSLPMYSPVQSEPDWTSIGRSASTESLSSVIKAALAATAAAASVGDIRSTPR